jgi:uncharacterized protein
MTIRVRVQPGAKKTRIGGHVPGPNDTVEWKLYVTAPALEGKANDVCIEFLARGLGIARSRVTLVAGAKSRHKVIELDGVSEADFLRFANGTKEEIHHKEHKGHKG